MSPYVIIFVVITSAAGAHPSLCFLCLCFYLRHPVEYSCESADSMNILVSSTIHYSLTDTRHIGHGAFYSQGRLPTHTSRTRGKVPICQIWWHQSARGGAGSGCVVCEWLEHRTTFSTPRIFTEKHHWGGACQITDKHSFCYTCKHSFCYTCGELYVTWCHAWLGKCELGCNAYCSSCVPMYFTHTWPGWK